MDSPTEIAYIFDELDEETSKIPSEPEYPNEYIENLAEKIAETKNYFSSMVEEIISKQETEYFNSLFCDSSNKIRENLHLMNKEKEVEVQKITKIEEYKKAGYEDRENMDPRVHIETGREKSALLTRIENNLKVLTQPRKTTKTTVLTNLRRKNRPQLEDVLIISKNTLLFNNVLPGYIMENELEINNKSNQNLAVKITIVCHNKELDDHDEYVFSVRKTSVYDYNDKISLIIPAFSTIKVKIALKVPNIKQETSLKGSCLINVNGFDSSFNLPISASVIIPEIICPKEIYDEENECKTLKFALKKGKKQECKIPLKNNFGANLDIEFELIESKEEEYRRNKVFDILLHPNVGSIGARGIALVNLLFKPNLRTQGNGKYIRTLLLARIKSSSLIYFFPIDIEIY